MILGALTENLNKLISQWKVLFRGKVCIVSGLFRISVKCIPFGTIKKRESFANLAQPD